MWRNWVISIFSYLDVDTRKDKYSLSNPTYLECITGYIMEDDVGDSAFKSLSHIRLDLIDGYISS